MREVLVLAVDQAEGEEGGHAGEVDRVDTLGRRLDFNYY